MFPTFFGLQVRIFLFLEKKKNEFFHGEILQSLEFFKHLLFSFIFYNFMDATLGNVWLAQGVGLRSISFP